MDRLTWREEYNIGIDRIDFQHRLFCDLLQWVAQQLKMPGQRDHMQILFEEIFAFTKYHFFSEENVMILNSYPEIEHHQKIHAELIGRLNYKISQIEFGEDRLEDLFSFLGDWFMNHTANEDQKIADFINSQTI